MRKLILVLLILLSFASYGQESKQFSKMWIVSENTISGFNWTDLNLEKESSFTTPIIAAWKKFLDENHSFNVEGVEVCDETCKGFLAQWQGEEIAVPEQYAKSVWLRISLNIKKLPTSDKAEAAFQWEGRVALLDIESKRLMGSYTVTLEERRYRNMDQKALNSALASSLYRGPLPGFKELNQLLDKSLRLSQSATVQVTGQRNVGDINALMELLKTRGKHLGIQVTLESFKGNEAKLICFYQGEEKAFSDLLSQLKELKSSHSYGITGDFTKAPFVMKLVNP